MQTPKQSFWLSVWKAVETVGVIAIALFVALILVSIAAVVAFGVAYALETAGFIQGIDKAGAVGFFIGLAVLFSFFYWGWGLLVTLFEWLSGR